MYYIQLTTNLPNLTNHLLADRIKKRIRLKSHLSCQGTTNEELIGEADNSSFDLPSHLPSPLKPR